FLALENDLSFIVAGRIDAREHFHQRRLAGPVFPHQRVDFTVLDGEIDVFERVHTGKALGDAAHFENGGHGASTLGCDGGRDPDNPGRVPGCGGAYWVIWSWV